MKLESFFLFLITTTHFGCAQNFNNPNRVQKQIKDFPLICIQQIGQTVNQNGCKYEAINGKSLFRCRECSDYSFLLNDDEIIITVFANNMSLALVDEWKNTLKNFYGIEPEVTVTGDRRTTQWRLPGLHIVSTLNSIIRSGVVQNDLMIVYYPDL